MINISLDYGHPCKLNIFDTYSDSDLNSGHKSKGLDSTRQISTILVFLIAIFKLKTLLEEKSVKVGLGESQSWFLGHGYDFDELNNRSI